MQIGAIISRRRSQELTHTRDFFSRFLIVGPGFLMGNVDTWGGHVVGHRLPEHGRLIVSGWAVDVKVRVPVKEVFAVSKGQILAAAKANISRPDVSEVHQCDDYHACGWALEVSASALGIGESEIEIYASTSDERLASRMGRKELLVYQVAPASSDSSEALYAIAFKRMSDLRIFRLDPSET